jgi:gamma-glutamyltranspeptidase
MRQSRNIEEQYIKAGLENVPFTTRPELVGSFGMVATTHWLGTAIGMRMLELGGNAFDAAVAAGFVMQIVEPNQNGPSGDLPIIFTTSERPKPIVLCAQGPAPASASIEKLDELGLDVIRWWCPASSGDGCSCCTTTAPCGCARS